MCARACTLQPIEMCARACSTRRRGGPPAAATIAMVCAVVIGSAATSGVNSMQLSSVQSACPSGGCEHSATCARMRGCGWRALVLRGGGGDGEGVVSAKGQEAAEPEESRKEQEKMEHDKALIGQLQAMRNECGKIKKRISMIAEEIIDHSEAAQVIEKFDAARSCKRAIGGVLIESTAGEVLPALQNEMIMLTKASDELTVKLHETEKAICDFQSLHDIRIVSEEFENTR